MSGKRFTQEQREWVRLNAKTFGSWAECTAAFNELFCDERGKYALADLCSKVLHAEGPMNKTRYKTGCRHKALPIGTIRKTETATFVKVGDGTQGLSGYQRPDWIPLQEKVWVDENGPLSEGEMVCFLDGDRENFNLSNLAVIDRKIAARLAQNGWWSSDPEITKTGILWCKLLYAIKDVKY